MMPPLEPPDPIKHFIEAALRIDVDTMFTLVDWQLTHAADWARSFDDPALPEDRLVEVTESGLQEMEHATLGMARNRLAQLALHLAQGGHAQPASDEQRARARAHVLVPPVVRPLPPHVTDRLAAWRARSANVSDPWAVITGDRTLWLMLNPERDRIIIIKQSAMQ
ncbi:MAG TPA: hypothetical protein VFD36_03725 [Kofleriaceae bacterium]|nr:hypothetical protein [Kofleriaceae bacterium]